MPLTGGVFDAQEAACISMGCIFPAGLSIRKVTAGIAQVVPVPAAIWLFSIALGLLGWMRRKLV